MLPPWSVLDCSIYNFSRLRVSISGSQILILDYVLSEGLKLRNNLALTITNVVIKKTYHGYN